MNKKDSFNMLRIALDKLEEDGLDPVVVKHAIASINPRYLDVMKSLGWKHHDPDSKFDWMLERDLVLEGLRALRAASRYPGEIPRPAVDAVRAFVERHERHNTTTVGAAYAIRDFAVLMIRNTEDEAVLINETARQIAEKLIRMEEAKHLLQAPRRQRH
jgi:hypothetical protein